MRPPDPGRGSPRGPRSRDRRGGSGAKGLRRRGCMRIVTFIAVAIASAIAIFTYLIISLFVCLFVCLFDYIYACRGPRSAIGGEIRAGKDCVGADICL